MPDTDEIARLRAAVDDLERRVAQLEGRPAAPVPLVAKPEPEPKELESRLGLTIVNRIGALTLAIGIIFFFKYAVDSAWVGPWGRVLLGLLGGLLLIGFAEWLRRRNQQVFSQGIAGCGLAALYTSLYASFGFYQLVPESAAFFGMVAACALATALSLQYENPAIASLALAGAILTPPLLGNLRHEPWLLFPYLALLDIASVAMAVRRRWPVLHLLAFVGTATLFGFSQNNLFWLSGFYVLFLFTSFRTRNLWILSLNTLWALIMAWLLGGAYVFAIFGGVIAAVQFTLAIGERKTGPLYATLYVSAQADFLAAALRLLGHWAAGANLRNEADSIFLGLYALVLIAIGVVRSATLDRIIGLTLIGIVICKLYCYDVWLLSRFYRITAFVVLGILLLAASYLYSRFKDKLDALITGKQ